MKKEIEINQEFIKNSSYELNFMKDRYSIYEQKVQNILNKCGIDINKPGSANITVHDRRFYKRVISDNSLGLGESYMDGWWDCEALDLFFTKIFLNKIYVYKNINLPEIIAFINGKFLNIQKLRSFKIGHFHYDLGNSFYKAMLGPGMDYSCAYWKKAKTLEEAQNAKLDLICRKLNLQKGQKILDIGCGWGNFAKFAAQNYGAKVVGITVSRKQEKFARENTKNLPVEIRYQDYHDINEVFDHIVSIGMFEHVGYKNYRDFFRIIHRCCSSDGLFLLHTIGNLHSSVCSDPWLTKYIFPDSIIPSLNQITRAVEGILVVEDLHNFGSDYDKTLISWHSNFNENWEEFRLKYGNRFYRMWSYYLNICASLFRARLTHVWQIVFSKNGLSGGYSSVR